MGFVIGMTGVVVMILASLAGFLVCAGSRGRGRAVIAVTGAISLAAYIAWGAVSDDGQPWAVWLSSRGASNTDEVRDGPLTGLVFRTLLRAVGVGLLLSWALVAGADWRRRRKTGD